MLLGLFLVILAAGASEAGGGPGGLPAALLHGPADWAALEPAVPIMFLALVYHDLVPVIVSYLGGDRKTIRWVLPGGVLGGASPQMSCCCCWGVLRLK